MSVGDGDAVPVLELHLPVTGAPLEKGRSVRRGHHGTGFGQGNNLQGLSFAT